jgi:hypothetical protein
LQPEKHGRPPNEAAFSGSLTINSHGEPGADSPEASAMIEEFKKMVIVSIAFGLFIVAAQMAAGLPLYEITTGVQVQVALR